MEYTLTDTQLTQVLQGIFDYVGVVTYSMLGLMVAILLSVRMWRGMLGKP